MKSFHKKITGMLCSIALLSTTVLPVYANESVQEDFDEFLNEKFIEEMESDYLSMHYTVKDYKSFDIIKPEAVVGDASIESYQESIDEYTTILNELEAFDYDALTATQQHDYDAYKFYLENMIRLNSDMNFDEIFSPSTGIQENLLTNFTEFVFYEREDVDDYLSVLASVPSFIDQALEITKIQASNGYFLTDNALNDTIDGIEKFVAKTDDNQLIIIFEERMDELDFLTDDEKEDYKEINRDIVINQYIPAYNKIVEELEPLRGSRKQDGGMAGYGEDGETYYRSLVRYKTSSDMSVEDQIALAEDFIMDQVYALIELLYSGTEVTDEELEEEISSQTPEEILQYLQDHLDDYPEGPEVVYHPSYLDPSVANDSTVAYYMQPPFDDLKENVIKINGDNISNVNDLYETLAHEGFPGHLYQITWYLDTNPAYIRTTMNNIGYTEGWAMYTEICEWLYADINENAQKYHQIDTSLGYVLNAVADLGVNGLNWSKEDLANWIDSTGLSGASSSYLYDYVVENPGLILPYGMGLVHFFNLRSIAEEALGDDFDLKEFNTVLLTYGDRPFELVQSDVEAYINGKTGSAVIESAKPETSSNPEATATAEVEPTPAPASSSNNTGFIVGGVAVAVIILVLILRRRHGNNHPAA